MTAPQSLFESLDRCSTDAVSLHDHRGDTLRITARGAEVLGSAAAQLGSQPLWALAREGDRERFAQAFESVAQDGITRYHAWRVRENEDGSAGSSVETRIALASELHDGGASYLLCVSREVSGRDRRTEGHLQLQDDARAFIHRAVHGIYRSSISGKFLYANPALVKLLGYNSPEELYKVDIATQVYAEPSEREVLLRRFREGRLGGWTHVRWKTKDGSIIVIRVVVNAVRDEHDEIKFFEGAVEDVTESLRREEILRRNERMASLGTMLAGVAHELNNPLAAISGFAQIILRGDTLSEDDRAAVDTINHEANRAARIVRDLQTFARERSYLHREEVDLNDVISYVLASQRYRMDTHGIRRKVILAPALPPIGAERAHVEQILINLIANASQALESITDAPAAKSVAPDTRVPPTITVRTFVRGGDVVMEVHDNGPGISEENLPRIFDPFFTTRAEGEGTGLGLAVVHGIVNSYAGSLDVQTELGQGSLFRVTFPIMVHDGESGQTDADSAPSTSTPPVSQSLEILVVEDELAIRRLLARYFESRGHSVTTAGDGTTALRMAEQSAFDVVICDLRLPGIDGFEVLRRLRELPTGARSRCILMSGANSQAPTGPLRDSVRLAAVVDKPFEIEQLRRVVEG